MSWRPQPPAPNWNWVEVLVIVGLLVILGGAYVTYADFIYGDWRCAFAQCRIETK